MLTAAVEYGLSFGLYGLILMSLERMGLFDGKFERCRDAFILLGVLLEIRSGNGKYFCRPV